MSPTCAIGGRHVVLAVPPSGGLLRFLTAGFLGPYFREQMGARRRPIDQRRFENLFVPRFVRFAPTYVLMYDVRRRMREHRAMI